MQLRSKAKSITQAAVLCALALVLSLIDSAVSAALPFVPGIKLGLAGGVTLYVLYALDAKTAFWIVLARCLLTALLSGAVTMLLFSIAGGMASLGVMILAKKGLSVIKTSVLGGVSHNIAQVAVACLITQTPGVAWYLAVLVIAGTLSGFAMGVLAGFVLRRMKRSGYAE